MTNANVAGRRPGASMMSRALAHRPRAEPRDRHQLSRSAGALDCRRRDPARDPAHQHRLLPSSDCLPGRVRAHVRGRRRPHRLVRDTARLHVDHDLVVARVRGPRPRAGLRRAGAEPVPPRRRRGRRLPGGDQGRRRVVPRPRALHGDGHHQRRNRDRRGRRAAAHRRGDHRCQLAVGVLRVRRRGTRVDGLVGARVLHARATSSPDSGRTDDDRRGVRHTRHGTAGDVLGQPARPAPGVGPRAREVPHRRRLVLLSVLAPEVSLRRARLRREAGGRLRVDSVRRRRRSEA